MWEVDNDTKYADAHSWDRDKSGADTWIVVVKGTFDILPDGSTRVSDEQLPVCTIPEHFGAPGESSLRLETDLIRVKPSTDVLVLGHAYAPHATPVTQVDVTLKIEAFEKTLRVFGDRAWGSSRAGARLAPPKPFLRVPLVYERAFGGADRRSSDPREHNWDERNPVGVGFVASPTDGELRAPNVEYPGELMSSPTQRPRPAGFGPISAHWLPRRQWAGTYDAKWEQERKPLAPDDLDDRFFLCAPPDQQWPTHLRGGETIELVNMSLGGVLSFRLPRVILGFETVFGADEPILHRQALHSVIVEPDVPRVSMVWQTALPCHSKVLKLEHTRVTEKVHVLADGM